MTGPRKQRTLSGDLKESLDVIGLVGGLMTLAILGAPAAFATVTGAPGSVPGENVFWTVLLVTLPLSAGLVVWWVGLDLVPDTHGSSFAMAIWSAIVAAGAIVASSSLGAAVVNITGTPPAPGPFGFAFRALEAFYNAYGAATFFLALAAGGTLIWLYQTYVHPRIFSDV